MLNIDYVPDFAFNYIVGGGGITQSALKYFHLIFFTFYLPYPGKKGALKKNIYMYILSKKKKVDQK